MEKDLILPIPTLSLVFQHPCRHNGFMHQQAGGLKCLFVFKHPELVRLVGKILVHLSGNGPDTENGSGGMNGRRPHLME